MNSPFTYALMSLGVIAFSQQTIAKEVDYLKCEAMQRAVDRITQSPLMVQGMINAGLEEELRILNTGRSPSRVDVVRARLEYANNLRNGIGDPVKVNEMSKLMRIEADMKASGCPN
jgi:hypothetical protein